MRLMVFAVYDEKAAAFAAPFCLTSKGLAVRSFADAVADKNTQLAKHPGEYKLYLLAEYDDNSGAFVSLPQPEFLSCGSEFISEVKNG